MHSKTVQAVSIAGGKRQNYLHGAFLLDVARRHFCLSSSVTKHSYSFASSGASSCHWKGLLNARDLCNEFPGYPFIHSATELESFRQGLLDIHSFQYGHIADLPAGSRIYIHVAGHGNEKQGIIITPSSTFTNEVYNYLPEDSQVLLVVDGDGGAIHFFDRPSNVALIATEFASCVTIPNAKDGAAVGTAMTWALLSGLSAGAGWMSETQKAWNNIAWTANPPTKDRDLLMDGFNESEWSSLFPAILRPSALTLPARVEADEVGMFEFDALGRFRLPSLGAAMQEAREYDLPAASEKVQRMYRLLVAASAFDDSATPFLLEVLAKDYGGASTHRNTTFVGRMSVSFLHLQHTGNYAILPLSLFHYFLARGRAQFSNLLAGVVPPTVVGP